LGQRGRWGLIYTGDCSIFLLLATASPDHIGKKWAIILQKPPNIGKKWAIILQKPPKKQARQQTGPWENKRNRNIHCSNRQETTIGLILNTPINHLSLVK
jgi:hypothetical protein